METVKLIRVFIASPGDTVEERDEIEKIIYKWNRLNVNHRKVVLMPVRWEYDSTASYGYGYSGQRKINEQILFDSDILIAVFYKKLGTRVDGYESGTVAEIENFYTRKQDGVGVFFKNAENFSSEEIDEYVRLNNYRKTLYKRGLFQEYAKENIERYLEVEVNKLLNSSIPVLKKGVVSFQEENTDHEETGMDLYLKRNSRKSRKVIKAKARFGNGQYTVLKGSMIERIDSTSIPDHIKEARIKADISQKGILLEDVSFSSPSSAAGFVIGGTTNGKTDWKTKDGIVLKDIIERK